jgi:hypothetical protein
LRTTEKYEPPALNRVWIRQAHDAIRRRATTSGGSMMLTQSTLNSRRLLSRRRLLAVLAAAGLALTGAAPAGAESLSLNFSHIELSYSLQKADGAGQVAAEGATTAGKAS